MSATARPVAEELAPLLYDLVRRAAGWGFTWGADPSAWTKDAKQSIQGRVDRVLEMAGDRCGEVRHVSGLGEVTFDGLVEQARRQHEHIEYLEAHAIAQYDRAEQLQVEVSRLREEPRGWQTIDTAPKDGTAVLLWRDQVYPVRWTHSEVMGPVWATPDGHVIFNATHWMPSPGGPETPNRGEG